MLALCHLCWTHTIELVMWRGEQLAKKKKKGMSSRLSSVTGKRQQWITGKCKTIRGKKASNKGDSTVMSGSLEEAICRWIEKWRRNGSRQVKANFWCWEECFILLVWGPSLKRVFIYGVNFISSTNCTPVRDKKIIKITTMLNQLASIGILSWIGAQLN